MPSSRGGDDADDNATDGSPANDGTGAYGGGGASNATEGSPAADGTGVYGGGVGTGTTGTATGGFAGASRGMVQSAIDHGVPPGYARSYADVTGKPIDQAIQDITNARHEHNPTAAQTSMNATLDSAFGAANPGVTGLMDVAMTALGGIPGFGAVSAIGNLTNKAEGRPSVGFGISDVFGASKPGIADKARAGITDAARSGVTSVSNALGEVDASISDSIGSTPSQSDTSRAGGPDRDGGGAATDGSDQQVPITTQTPTGIAAVATPSLTRTALDSSHNSVIDTWRQILGDSIFGTRRTV